MDSHHEAPTEPITGGSRPPIMSNKTLAQAQSVRTRRGNPILSFLLFLLGIMLGVLATLFFILFVVHDRPPIQTTASTQPSSLTVQISRTYLTQLTSGKLKTSGLPGDISNVQVMLTNSNLIQITGTDSVNVLGIGSITTPFTLTLQPYTQTCQPKVRLIHADLGNIPVTDFAQNYEDQINQAIQLKSSDLPSGFNYCATSVHTQSDSLNVVYSATPA